MKYTPFILAAILAMPLLACEAEQPRIRQITQPQRAIKGATGTFKIQNVGYNDLDGTYTLQLFERVPPTVETANIKMVPLTDKEVADSVQSYAVVSQNETVMHLSKDTKIEYIKAETSQSQANRVVVRNQRVVYWEPFADTYLVSEIYGSHSVHYVPYAVYPPVYESGRPLRGVGSYGRSYTEARTNYKTRNKVEPPSVRYATLRKSGKLTTKPGVKLRTKTTQPTTARTTRKPTGSGVGSSNLKPNKTRVRRSKPSSSFGRSRPSSSRSSSSRPSSSRSRRRR